MRGCGDHFAVILPFTVIMIENIFRWPKKVSKYCLTGGTPFSAEKQALKSVTLERKLEMMKYYEEFLIIVIIH